MQMTQIIRNTPDIISEAEQEPPECSFDKKIAGPRESAIFIGGVLTDVKICKCNKNLTNLGYFSVTKMLNSLDVYPKI